MTTMTAPELFQYWYRKSQKTVVNELVKAYTGGGVLEYTELLLQLLNEFHLESEASFDFDYTVEKASLLRSLKSHLQKVDKAA